MKSQSARAMLAAAIGSIIFGFSFLFSKRALVLTAPSVLLMWRFLFAAVLMSVALLAGHARFSLRGKPVGKLLLLTVSQPVCYFLCENYGLERSTATFSAVMIALIPIASLLFAAVFLREAPTFGQVAFSVLGVAGVVWMALLQAGEGTVEPAGVVLLLGAIVSAVAFNVLSRSLSRDFSAFERTYMMFLVGAAFFSMLALLECRENLRMLVDPLREGEFLQAVFFLGGLSSVGAFLMQNYATTYLPLARTSAFANLTTVVSVFAGAVFLGEKMNGAGIAACCMIVVGIWGVQKMRAEGLRSARKHGMIGKA